MPGIPICVYVPTIGMFRVTQAKGKCFASGGYGVHIATTASSVDVAGGGGSDRVPDDVHPQDPASCSDHEASNDEITDADQALPGRNASALSDEGDHDGAPNDPTSSTSASLRSVEHLFIEEALFLHQRGLLEVLSENGTDSLDFPTLFAMLSELNVSFSAYLTYAHLRAQTFIVLRHTDRRLDLVKRISEMSKSYCHGPEKRDVDGDDNCESERKPITWKKRKRRNDIQELQRELKEEALNAPPPSVIDSNGCIIHLEKPYTKRGESRGLTEAKGTSESDKDLPTVQNQNRTSLAQTASQSPSSSLSPTQGAATTPTKKLSPIAFDVYKPNSNFRKTNPGLPDFCVVITSYSEPSPPFHSLLEILKACKGVPLRLATVADGGSVVMFGLTDMGVPSITS